MSAFALTPTTFTMSPVVNLARRASPSPRGTINDENVHTTSSGRASRSGLKDLKSVWAGQAMRLRGSSGDGSFRKRAPLSNTTNTSNNRPGSQIYRDNELADSSADFDATTAEELNLSSSIDRQRASSVMPPGSPFPFGSPLQDDSRRRLTAPATPIATAPGNQPSPHTPRLSSEENHGGSSKGSSPRRRADLSINVEAANARRNQGRLSTPSRDTGGPPSIPRGATDLGSSPSHTQAVAPRPRPHDTASPSASDKGHMLGAPQPSPSVESSLINHATVAVLQERFGVSHINQLPPETSRELLGGGLVSLVVKYIRRECGPSFVRSEGADIHWPCTLVQRLQRRMRLSPRTSRHREGSTMRARQRLLSSLVRRHSRLMHYHRRFNWNRIPIYT